MGGGGREREAAEGGVMLSTYCSGVFLFVMFVFGGREECVTSG
jgi:hypothetical protein